MNYCINIPYFLVGSYLAIAFGLAGIAGCGDESVPASTKSTDSLARDMDDSDSEASHETPSTATASLRDATNVVPEEVIDPEAYREQQLRLAQNAYLGERAKEDELWQAKELSLLKAFDAGLVSASANELAVIVDNAERTLEAWDRDIVELWTNDTGKRLAADENVAMAVLRQNDIAAIPTLRSSLASCKALMSSLKNDNTNDGYESRRAADDQIERLKFATTQLRTATSRCAMARATIRHYASSAEKSATESDDLPTLQAVIERLTRDELSDGVSELDAAGYTEKLSSEETERFTGKMLELIPTLEASSRVLRSLSGRLHGTRDGGLKITLNFTKLTGPQFTARLYFSDRNDGFEAAFDVAGEIVKSELRFRTTKIVEGSRLKYDVNKGFNYEGKIGSRTIDGKYYLRELGLGDRVFIFNHGKLSFDLPRPME